MQEKKKNDLSLIDWIAFIIAVAFFIIHPNVETLVRPEMVEDFELTLQLFMIFSGFVWATVKIRKVKKGLSET